MNESGLASYLRHEEQLQHDKELCKEIELTGAVLASFYIVDSFNMMNEVTVYEYDNRKFWVRKYDHELVEFREIT